MNYLAQLNEMRNKMHQEIILHVIKDNRDPNDFLAELDRPFIVEIEEYRPTHPNLNTIVTVTGIDGTTGEIIAEDNSGTELTVHYHDLTLETLAMLHGEIIGQQYKVKHAA